MAQKEPAPSGTRKRAATYVVPMMSLIRQPKRARNDTVGQLQILTQVGVQVSPTSAIPPAQPVTLKPSKHFGAAQPKAGSPISHKHNPQAPTMSSPAAGSEQKKPVRGSEADDSSDDELPEINLTVPDVSNKEKSEKSEAKLPAELLGDPHQTFGSLVNKTGERKVEHGSNISQLLQPVIQKMESKEQQIAVLQNELEEKRKEISQFKETEKELRQTHSQLDAKCKELESQLQTTAKQHEQRLLEEQKEVARLKEAVEQHANQLRQKDSEISQAVVLTQQKLSKQLAEQLQQKDQQIFQVLAQANQVAQSMQKQLQEKAGKISELETAAKQNALKIKEMEQQLSAAKELSNISEQKRKRTEQQLKTHKEKLQQLESTCKDRQLQLQQKDQEIAKHLADTKQQAAALQKREQEVSHLKEKLKKFSDSDQGELAQLKRLSKQQTTKIQELQGRLQDREKEVAQSREFVKRKLQEQERRIKDWLTAIPIHGLKVVDLPSYSS